MNTDWCYSGFGYRVYKNNILVGYVVSSCEKSALTLAQQKYGKYVIVSRVSAP